MAAWLSGVQGGRYISRFGDLICHHFEDLDELRCLLLRVVELLVPLRTTHAPRPTPHAPRPMPHPTSRRSLQHSALASLTRLGIDNVLARIGVDRAGVRLVLTHAVRQLPATA